jgi:hypothetical protein
VNLSFPNVWNQQPVSCISGPKAAAGAALSPGAFDEFAKILMLFGETQMAD